MSFLLPKSKMFRENTLKLATILQKETKESKWKLKNFKYLVINCDKKDKEIASWTFSAGDKIGIPSQWRFVLKNTSLNEISLGLFCPECETMMEIKASFTATIMCRKWRGGVAFSTDNSIGKYIPSDKNGWMYTIGELSKILASHCLTKDGSLIIKIHFEMFGNVVNEGKMKQTIGLAEKKHSETLQDVVITMLNDPECTNVTLNFSKDGTQLQAHKNILSERSPVFKKMLVIDMKENATGTIVIDDITSEGMKFVLDFIYMGLPSIHQKKAKGLTWVKYAEEIAYASNKYDLPILKEFCNQNLIQACNKNNAMALLQLSLLIQLKKAAVDISNFVKANIQNVMPLTSHHHSSTKTIEVKNVLNKSNLDSTVN